MNCVELTQQLVRLNTINPPGNEREAARIIGNMLERSGFSVAFYEFDDARTSLVARSPSNGTGKALCLTGHLDTVPLGNAKWSVDPFSAEISKDKIFGRGTSDMKAGVAAFVCAAIEFAHQHDMQKTPGIILVITAGEETGCQGAYHLSNAGNALGDAAAVVVGEPTSNYPLLGHKGALWLDITATGVTSHGSMPELGVNAIHHAAEIVAKLRDFNFKVKPHEVLGSPTLNVATIKGGMNINSVPDLVNIGVDIRTIPGMVHMELMDDLYSYLSPAMANVSIILDLEPVWSDPDHPWIKTVLDICAKQLGNKPALQGANYFSDACALQPTYKGAPVVILGPGESRMAHQTDEYCLVSKIEQAVRIYSEIIGSWCLQLSSPSQPERLKAV